MEKEELKKIHNRIKTLTDEINYFLNLIYASPSVYTSYIVLDQLKSRIEEIELLNGILRDCLDEEGTGSKKTKEVLNPIKEEKKFTLNELEQYDGKDGKPAYVAVEGVVYEVTGNTAWALAHQGLPLGTDLTEQFNLCHGTKQILKKLNIVGRIVP